MHNKTVSPSRTYVAVCDSSNFKGYFFRKFVLPKDYENNSEQASWYFLNRLNFFACIYGCISFEDYSNISDQETIAF